MQETIIYHLNEAKQLLYDGITIAEKGKKAGVVIDFKKRLLSLGDLLNDTNLVRNTAAELFELDNHNIEYYKIIKNTYPLAIWETEKQSIVSKILQSQSYYQNATLAAIYIEDGEMENLLGIVEKMDIQFIDEYIHHLLPLYTEQLMNIYKAALLKYAADNIGRPHYVAIRKYLKIILKWKNGSDTVNEIKQILIATYRSRRALLEELAKI